MYYSMRKIQGQGGSMKQFEYLSATCTGAASSSWFNTSTLTSSAMACARSTPQMSTSTAARGSGTRAGPVAAEKLAVQDATAATLTGAGCGALHFASGPVPAWGEVGDDVRAGGSSRTLGELRGSTVGAQGQSACSRMSCVRFGTHILWSCVPRHARLHSARGVRGFVSQERKELAFPDDPAPGELRGVGTPVDAVSLD